MGTGALATIIGLVGSIMASEPIALDWTAPSSCPSQAAVLDRIHAALPPDPTPGLYARVTILEEPEGFGLEATVGTDEGESTRRLKAATCEELADATVLLVTLIATRGVEEDGTSDTGDTEPTPAADPSSDAPSVPAPAGEPRALEPVGVDDPSQGAPPPQDPRRASTARPSDDSSPSPSVAPGDPPRRGIEGRAAVFGGVVGLALPAVTGSIAGQAGVGGRGWEVTLGAHYWIRRQVALEQEARGRFELAAAQLRGCGVPSKGSIDVPLCGAVAVGAVVAAGTEGLVSAKSAAHLWLGLSASAALRWWWSDRWGAALRVRGVIAPARPTFEIGGIGPVCCNRGGVEGAVGIVGRWGRNGSGRRRTITP